MLKTEKGSKLTAKEIGRNVKLARDAALDVVHKSKKQQLKQKAQPLNFRTVGVRQTPSGKWVSLSSAWYTIFSLIQLLFSY